MRFFPLFFRLVHRNCLIFGTKVNIDNPYTLEILKLFGTFLMRKKSCVWHPWCDPALTENPRKSLKNLKVGVFETDFKQVPFVFRQTTCTYSESLGPIENLVTTLTKNHGFLGVPRTLIFDGFSLYFQNSLREKRSEVKKPRETACFRLVHQNCLNFGSIVSLNNNYTLAVLNVFGKLLISSNPL